MKIRMPNIEDLDFIGFEKKGKKIKKFKLEVKNDKRTFRKSDKCK